MPQQEVIGRCFDHRYLKQPVVLGINYVNYLDLAIVGNGLW